MQPYPLSSSLTRSVKSRDQLWRIIFPILLWLQNTHLPPLLTQLRNALSHTLGGHKVLHYQKIKFFSECEEVGEERIEVRFDGEVEDLLEMGMVKMGKNTEKVLIDVFGRVCKWVVKRFPWMRVKCRVSNGGLPNLPDFVGKTFSSSKSFCNQLITKSMYVGAARETSLWLWSGQRKFRLNFRKSSAAIIPYESQKPTSFHQTS